MDLSRSLIEEKAREYASEEPFHTVEAEHVEMLPETFADDAFGWRDAEWVVQWYYRRHLGAYPDSERRDREARYGENDFGTVLETLPAVFDHSTTADRLEILTSLAGIDVPVGSAFLQFMFPDRYVVLGEREWRTLVAAGELDGSYPNPPSIADYERFHAVCRNLLDRFDLDAWTLYRAIWRLGTAHAAP